MPTLDIIVPVYNEECCISQVLTKLCELKAAMSNQAEIGIIFVDDGSEDSSLKKLTDFSKENTFVKILSFTRNFGHQSAIWAGLEHSNADYIAIIDADLQDPPELIRDMLNKAVEEDLQVVCSKRKARKQECFCKKITASIYYRLLNLITTFKIPNDTGDFRLIRRDAADALINMKEKNKFLRGMIPWLGLKSAQLEYVRDGRIAGQTKFTLAKMFKLANDGIYAFSYKPVSLIAMFASLLLVAALLLSVTGLIYHASSFMLGGMIIFGCSVQLYAVAILGQYIIRIFDETKDRPVYVLKEKINF